MAAKQEELKQRLAAVLRDIQRHGGSDPESVWLIGSLAAELADKGKARSWPALKEKMTQEMYDGLLRDFQTNGNALYQAGETKKAYAIQALGLSLVCRTQRHDPVLRQGEALLDSMIDGATKIFRKTQGRKPG